MVLKQRIAACDRELYVATSHIYSSVNQQAIPVGELLDVQHLLQENHTLR